MWVVTKSVNDYNQYGDYFVCVFQNKPTVEELKASLGVNASYARKLLAGGGRINDEAEWYFLTEMQSGQIYES